MPIFLPSEGAPTMLDDSYDRCFYDLHMNCLLSPPCDSSSRVETPQALSTTTGSSFLPAQSDDDDSSSLPISRHPTGTEMMNSTSTHKFEIPTIPLSTPPISPQDRLVGDKPPSLPKDQKPLIREALITTRCFTTNNTKVTTKVNEYDVIRNKRISIPNCRAVSSS
jgi:hypothetical protein